MKMKFARTGKQQQRFVRRSSAVAAVVEMMEQRMLLSAGSLDTTFGKGGIVTMSPPAGDLSVSGGTAVQADGKVLEAVEFHATTSGFPTVASQIRRLLIDGSPDPSFGVGGIVTLPVADHVSTLLIQPNGQIVLAGNVLGRLNTDGSLDKSFAAGKGIEVIATGNAAAITSAGLQPDGGIVVDFPGVSRFNANGSRDMTFGQNGIAVLPAASAQFPNSLVGGITTDSSGRILVSVSDHEQPADSSDDIRTTYGVVRLLTNGTADSSFGNHGLSLDENSTAEGFSDNFDSNAPGRLAVGSDGTIYQIGYRPEDVGEVHTQIFAYSSNGLASSSAQSFDMLGPSNLIGQPDGKLLVFSQHDLQDLTVSVFRFLSYSKVNGSSLVFDPSFNGTGEKDIQLFNQPSSVIQNILLTGDGRIVLSAMVAGFTDVARLNGDVTQTASGKVFNDLAGGGSINSSDTGVAGADVYADLNNNGRFDTGEPETSTTSNGSYALGMLPSRPVIIRQVVPAGERQTFPALNGGDHVTIGATPVTGANFAITTKILVSGNVFNDTNGDGKKGIHENGIGSVRVYADLNNNGKFDSKENFKFTDPDGNFSFVSLPPGNYVFRAEAPIGWSQTIPTNNFGQHVTLGGGGIVAGVQFGFRQNAGFTESINGTVFNDANGDGKQDNNELNPSSWIAYLDLDNIGHFVAGDPTATTGNGIGFMFGNVAPGNYIVRLILQTGWQQTTPSNNFGWHVTVTDGRSVGGLVFGEIQIK